MKIEKLKKGEVFISLKTNFTEDEKREMAANLANKLNDKKGYEDELQSIKSRFKSSLDLVESEINKISSDYRAGYEYRRTKCVLTLNYLKKEREYANPETGKILKTEPLQDSDYQGLLPIEAEGF